MKAAYVGIDILYPALTSLYDTGCEILKVFTCNTDNVTEFNTATVSFAKDHGIPVQTERIKRDDLYHLLDMGCDFVLVGGYYYVIPVIEELRIVNTHPAYLPIGRGGWPMPQTILKGMTESGVTMHRMTKDLDEGAIILRRQMPVYPDTDNLETFTKRQWELIPDMVKELVADFDNLWNNAAPQPEDAEYWQLPEKEDYTVRDTDDFARADLVLRAFYGYECYYIDTKTNTEYELIRASAHKGEPMSPAPGHKLFTIEGGYISSPRTRCV
jgi:methionyl-tRNA formyltransferase